MLSAGEHGLELVVCSGFTRSSAPSATAHHQHEHHHSSGEEGSSGHQSTDRAPCPYAIAGSPCTSVAWTSPDLPAPQSQSIDFHSQISRGEASNSLDRIRGPPVA